MQRTEQPAFISKAKRTGRRHACMSADPDIWRADGMSMKGECLKCEFKRRLGSATHGATGFHKQSQANGAAPCLHERRPGHLARRRNEHERRMPEMRIQAAVGECNARSNRLSSTGHSYMEDDLLILTFAGQLSTMLFYDLSGDGKTKSRSTGS